MSDSLDFVFLQCLVAAAGLVLLLIRRQTAFMGITCLFAFSVASASLAAFFFGRFFGLREEWITAEHEKVFDYSGWACLAIVAAMWLAWRPRKDEDGSNSKLDLFPWVTERFVYFALALGVAGTLASPLLAAIPTVGTAVHLFSSWLKLGLIMAVILFKKEHKFRPLLISILLYIPAGAVYALTSGHTPLSLDAIVPIALVATCLNRVTLISFAKLALWMLPCVYLMFGWMASRGAIRSGDLDQFSMTERASRFGDVFVYELMNIEFTPFDIQNLLFERIDMSDILAQETAFETGASGEDQFAYGGTLVNGAIDLVPRAVWEDKPIVAGYSNFVGQFTGVQRDDTTAVGVPVQFELYANGGPPVVIVGLFILFYLCARLEQFIATTKRPLHILMPSLMFLMAFANGIEQIMLDLAMGVAGALSLYVVARAIEIFLPQLLPQFRTAKRRRTMQSALPATA